MHKALMHKDRTRFPAPPALALIAPALIALALLALAACSNDETPRNTGNTQPAKAVLTDARLLKAGDFDALARNVLPPADYKAYRADWQRQHLDTSKITDEDRRKFAQTMQRLSAPGAEKKLYAQLLPQLKAFDKQYRDQVPMLVGVGQTMLITAVENAKQLTPMQKQQAKATVRVLAGWAQTVKWADPARARQAIDVACATARKLGFKTLDQAYALDYPQAMKAYATGWGGLKQLLAIYGLDLDRVLDSVQANTLDSKGDLAHVHFSYQLLDSKIDGQTTLVQRDGHWYSRDLIARLERERTRMAQAGSAPAVTASATR